VDSMVLRCIPSKNTLPPLSGDDQDPNFGESRESALAHHDKHRLKYIHSNIFRYTGEKEPLAGSIFVPLIGETLHWHLTKLRSQYKHLELL